MGISAATLASLEIKFEVRVTGSDFGNGLYSRLGEGGAAEIGVYNHTAGVYDPAKGGFQKLVGPDFEPIFKDAWKHFRLEIRCMRSIGAISNLDSELVADLPEQITDALAA